MHLITYPDFIPCIHGAYQQCGRNKQNEDMCSSQRDTQTVYTSLIIFVGISTHISTSTTE